MYNKRDLEINSAIKAKVASHAHILIIASLSETHTFAFLREKYFFNRVNNRYNFKNNLRTLIAEMLTKN